MNISRTLGDLLRIKGHVVRHVADIGMFRATDWEIVQEAKQKQEVIITHDLDYGHLLALSGERSPSVVIFRLRDMSIQNQLNCFVRVQKDIETPLSEGSILIIEDACVRIRSLPIHR